VKVAEAKELEVELQRLRQENAELKRRNAEIASLEAARKKAEDRAEDLEAKVRSVHIFAE
jgi:homeobox protein cut-like